MTTLALIADTISDSPVVEIVTGRCLRSRLNSYDCTLCVDSCTTQALAADKGGVQLEPEKCSGCGRCIAVCPGEAFIFPGYDLYQTLVESNENENVTLSCFRHKHTYPNEHYVPCVGALSMETLLFLGLGGKGSIHFNLIDCPACSNYPTIEVFLQSLARLQRQLGPYLRADLVAIKKQEQSPPMLPRDRRSFFLSIGNTLFSLVKTQYGSSRRNKEVLPPGNRRIPGKTALLHNIFTSGDYACANELLTVCTPSLSVHASCTLCPLCTGMCPTGALKINRQEGEKRLSFEATKCTGCGLCVEFCKKKALVVSPAPLFNCLAC